MDEGGGDIEFLLLTEDSSKGGERVQQRIVRLLLRAMDGQADTSRVSFAQMPAGAARDVLRGNRWREQPPSAPIDEGLRLLINRIASHLESSRRFCSFHYDGDAAWRSRESSTADRTFDEVIVQTLRRRLGQRRVADNLTDEQRAQRIEAALARLLPMVPYYSIEAWLYQNTDELRVACEGRSAEKNVVDQCLARCDEWAADRSLLDEVVMVKQSVCVKDTANDRLAETMSNAVFNEVLAANQSLAATRDRWLQSESLRANLEAIRSR
ncbi:MAG: hypothetical protein U0269_24445 [Polyangiales bacterium]